MSANKLLIVGFSILTGCSVFDDHSYEKKLQADTAAARAKQKADAEEDRRRYDRAQEKQAKDIQRLNAWLAAYERQQKINDEFRNDRIRKQEEADRADDAAVEAAHRAQMAEDARARAEFANVYEPRKAKANEDFDSFLRKSKEFGIEQTRLPGSLTLMSNPDSVKNRDILLDGLPVAWIESVQELESGGVSIRIMIPADNRLEVGSGRFYIEAPFAIMAEFANYWHRDMCQRMVLRLAGVAEFVNGLGMTFKLPKLRAVGISDSWNFATDREFPEKK